MDTPSSIFRATVPIVLASASPRRRELLGSLGVAFETDPAAGEEPCPLPGEEPEAYAVRMAETKAGEVAERWPDALVIGADTIVVLPRGREDDAPERRILGKPADAADALAMLAALSGATHRVVTGCCLIQPRGAENGRAKRCFAVSTDVTFARQPAEALAAYVATGEPMDKAGAYAIQGQGGFLVECIAGSYTNVVGLPVAEVLQGLMQAGAVRPVASS